MITTGGGQVARRATRQQTDNEIVARAVSAARQGDNDAVSYLYALYADAVHRSVTRILRDEHEAEDVTQQVFAKLSTALGRYQPSSMPFRAWLFRVARNAALDCARTRRCIPTDAVEPRTGSGSNDETSMSSLRDALAVLPEAQRNVVYLRHVLGLSPREIADRLGRSESAIHGLHHRGRAALRHELERLHAAPATRVRWAS